MLLFKFHLIPKQNVEVLAIERGLYIFRHLHVPYIIVGRNRLFIVLSAYPCKKAWSKCSINFLAGLSSHVSTTGSSVMW